ncbi:hypothetical protein PR003_g11051 [Phytophthora rubi]|uniref:Uncharacterized protein n=1 Tax=Phytophthora rubi TaxID=129364 RepID=A0A6A4FBV5_9STRA|nr:hypothetical protein PR003_g11051 [Phytophthora rubi]
MLSRARRGLVAAALSGRGVSRARTTCPCERARTLGPRASASEAPQSVAVLLAQTTASNLPMR